MKFMKDSFAYLHKALDTIDESNILGAGAEPVRLAIKISRMGLSTHRVSHPLDHYGQMVEYLRTERHRPARQPRRTIALLRISDKRSEMTAVLCCFSSKRPFRGEWPS